MRMMIYGEFPVGYDKERNSTLKYECFITGFTVKLRESEPKANDDRLVSRMRSALSEYKLKAQHELSAPPFWEE